MADGFNDAVLNWPRALITTDTRPSMDGVIRNSIITCPHCGFAQREEILIDPFLAAQLSNAVLAAQAFQHDADLLLGRDRKSTRLNSSHT